MDVYVIEKSQLDENNELVEKITIDTIHGTLRKAQYAAAFHALSIEPNQILTLKKTTL